MQAVSASSSSGSIADLLQLYKLYLLVHRIWHDLHNKWRNHLDLAPIEMECHSLEDEIIVFKLGTFYRNELIIIIMLSLSVF